MLLPGFFAGGRIADLLAAMQRHSRPVKPIDLGLIGKDHLAARFEAAGADLKSFKYKRAPGETDGVPDVIETAFGWCPRGKNERRIIKGINWSPAIGDPFRSLGTYGRSLSTVLADQRSGLSEPIIFVLHLARPRIEYTDHGKTAVTISGGNGDE